VYWLANTACEVEICTRLHSLATLLEVDHLSEVLLEPLQLTSNDAEDWFSLATGMEGLLMDEILVANGTIIHGTTDGKDCLK